MAWGDHDLLLSDLAIACIRGLHIYGSKYTYIGMQLACVHMYVWGYVHVWMYVQNTESAARRNHSHSLGGDNTPVVCRDRQAGRWQVGGWAAAGRQVCVIL